MLEGLEITEVLYSNIVLENRFDSEFFKRIFITNEKQLKSKPFFGIGEKFKVTDGEHGSVDFEDCGIKYLTAENIKKGYVDISKIRFVGEEVDKKNARASVRTGDILISIKGTLGEIAVAEDWLLPANMNRDVAIIKHLKKDNIASEFLSIFLMSKYGFIQSIRGGSGGVQQMITLERLRKFIIPILSDLFNKKIQNLYCSAQTLRINSQQTYSTAEILLKESLGMEGFDPTQESVNVKRFSESFGATGRLDAEYYQKKYEEYEELIKRYDKEWKPLIIVCNLKDSNFIPNEDTEYKYIELSNIGKSGEITGCTVECGKELPSRARRKVNKGDVVISSIEGSLESCALITEEYDNALCSTGFYVINSTEINSESLLVLFKSGLMQNILKKYCSGTILTAINKNEFQKIPVPIIDSLVQQQISDKVTESFRLKQQSERLLELARRAVELAVEIDEAAALAWIEEELQQTQLVQ